MTINSLLISDISGVSTFEIGVEGILDGEFLVGEVKFEGVYSGGTLDPCSACRLDRSSAGMSTFINVCWTFLCEPFSVFCGPILETVT